MNKQELQDKIYDLEMELRMSRACCDELRQAIGFEQSHNNFDAARLRRLATMVGVAAPEDDETLLRSAGTMIGSICRVIEKSAQ